MRNLIRKINRRLAKQGQKLCKSTPRQQSCLGCEYYILDVYTNTVIVYPVDPDKLAAELGC